MSILAAIDCAAAGLTLAISDDAKGEQTPQDALAQFCEIYAELAAVEQEFEGLVAVFREGRDEPEPEGEKHDTFHRNGKDYCRQVIQHLLSTRLAVGESLVTRCVGFMLQMPILILHSTQQYVCIQITTCANCACCAQLTSQIKLFFGS